MARTDTLPHFLTDVADAIREKGGTSETITASDFDTAIENLPSGGGKYAPSFVSFRDFTGNNLDYELANLDTSNMTTMANMFNGCTGITEIDISNFDTSKVTKINSMFYNCLSLRNIIGLDNLTFPLVTDCRNIFQSSKVTNAVLNFVEKHSVTIESAFTSCTELLSADIRCVSISSWNSFFYGCAKLSQVLFVNCDLNSQSSTTYLTYMFYNCTSLTSVDLSWMELPGNKKANCNYMFSGCTSLAHIDFRNFTFNNVTSYSSMFGSSASNGVPDNCEIIVKDDTDKSWLATKFSRLTNVKTVAEYEAE